MKIKVRKAKQEDIPSVYQLVKELAIHEKEPDAVTASLEDYYQDFADKIYEVLVAEEGNQIVGIAIYYMTYSTWKGKMLYLEDFVVAQSYRRRGIGQLLFDAYKAEAIEKKARLIKWQVLDWNEPAIAFYEKNGATIEKGWYNVKTFL